MRISRPRADGVAGGTSEVLKREVSAATNADPVGARLTVRSLTAGYGGTAVVRDINIHVYGGKITLIIGANGCGKSTLAKCVAGVIPSMAGQIVLDGEDLTRARSDQRAKKGLGYVPQLKNVFDTLTVAENLDVSGYTLDKRTFGERREYVGTIFPQLSALSKKLAANLSGGQKKMLATARVLMLRPAAVVVDEPTAGLSPALAQHFLSHEVRAIASSGAAVLLIEQRAIDALRVADSACVMAAGEIQLQASAEEILALGEERIVDTMLGGASYAQEQGEVNQAPTDIAVGGSRDVC